MHHHHSQGIFVNEHQCKHSWFDGDEEVQCHHRLWANTNKRAYEALLEQRKQFLAGGTKERGKDVYDKITFALAIIGRIPILSSIILEAQRAA